MRIKYDRATDAARINLSKKETKTKIPFCKRITVEFDENDDITGYAVSSVTDWIGKPMPDSMEEWERKILLSVINEFATHTCAPVGSAD